MSRLTREEVDLTYDHWLAEHAHAQFHPESHGWGREAWHACYEQFVARSENANAGGETEDAPKWKMVAIGHSAAHAKKAYPGEPITLWCRQDGHDYEVTLKVPMLGEYVRESDAK